MGCEFACVYCQNSFQTQLKRWAKGNCEQCYAFTPHTHTNRLSQQLPRTGYWQFIFTCSSGGIAFCPTDYLLKIVDRIKHEKEKTFLVQSKCPKTLKRVKFPANVIIGTTLETNRDELYKGISKAPGPSQRYEDFLEVNHPVKMITIEPVMDFDLETMVSWIEDISPCMVWLGYDSRKNNLSEPELEDVKNLYWELGRRGFTVVLKKIRKAWSEK
ncbi:MAG: hypothetical protein JSV16_09390 [Candidatus Hydrogenedentota bacterium]|nr:MAG: hypothetical protein JSV16_09390 [Candidatus Hydrogenedentota bacterium]